MLWICICSIIFFASVIILLIVSRMQALLRLQEIAEVAETLKKDVECEKQARRECEAEKYLLEGGINRAVHDMGTPLANIANMILQLQGTVAAPDRALLQEAHAHLGFAAYLVQTITEYAKLKAGIIRPRREPFSIQSVVSESCDLHRKYANEKNVRLKFHLAPELGQWWVGDAYAIETILVNLIGNAVRHTELGQVTIEVTSLVVADETEMVLTVRDTGVGIPADQYDKIFAPYCQIDAQPGKERRGLGLGLSIALAYARLLKGDIKVESTVGNGSRFIVRIRCQPHSGAIPAAREIVNPIVAMLPDPSAQPKRLLLIDDDVLARHNAVAQLAQTTAFEVIQLDDAKAALLLATTVLPGSSTAYPIDVILIDIEMPGLNGLEATRQLRAAGFEGKIIALTSHEPSQWQQKCLDAGMNDILSKPLDPNALVGPTEMAVARALRTSAEVNGSIDTVLDIAVLREEHRTIWNFLPTAVRSFQQVMPLRLKHLRTAVNQRDALKAAELAHTIKANTRIYAGMRPAKTAARIEELARNEILDWPGADQLLPVLESEVNRLALELDAFVRKEFR